MAEKLKIHSTFLINHFHRGLFLNTFNRKGFPQCFCIGTDVPKLKYTTLEEQVLKKMVDQFKLNVAALSNIQTFFTLFPFLYKVIEYRE